MYAFSEIDCEYLYFKSAWAPPFAKVVFETLAIRVAQRQTCMYNLAHFVNKGVLEIPPQILYARPKYESLKDE